MIVLVSSDLMFAGPVRAAAQSLGQPLKVLGKLPSVWEGELPQLVVLDMAGSKSSPAEVARIAKEISPTIRLLAFSPHVHVDAIREAETAGFHAVLTRGQFSRDPRGALGRLLDESESL